MAKFQLVSCTVNLAGDRNNAVFRGQHNPVTFPEALVLQAVHGGQEHVHTMVDVGTVERDTHEELERLTVKYGAIVRELFPAVGGRASLPQGDDNLPTLDDVKAANEAAAEAMSKSKSKGKSGKAKPKADADADAVPDLNDLPGDN
ncbi:hypothetical protein ADUPG1_006326 [Aduncisulcus paluster]|uniref:PRTRC system protein C n=1 Tax=Aduncisulcus paluster TaxID=2918883 RepID=A0ABQ5KHS2_9EUKA|nr:hypothetical protein ADUPG1_006326 [Aduncisulcus paluster]